MDNKNIKRKKNTKQQKKKYNGQSSSQEQSTFTTKEACSFTTDVDWKQIESRKIRIGSKTRTTNQPNKKNLKTDPTTRPKNDVEPEDRRRKRVKCVDLLPSKGKRAKSCRKRSGGAEEGDPRHTTNCWSYMMTASLDFGLEEVLINTLLGFYR